MLIFNVKYLNQTLYLRQKYRFRARAIVFESDIDTGILIFPVMVSRDMTTF